MDETYRFEDDGGEEDRQGWEILTREQHEAVVSECMRKVLTLLKLYQWCPRADCRRARACASPTIDKACIDANRDVVAPQLGVIMKDIARRMREQEEAAAVTNRRNRAKPAPSRRR